MYQGKYLAGRKPGAVPTPPQPKKQKQKQKKRITLGTIIFYFLYLMMILAAVVGIRYGMGLLEDWLVRFEASQPDTMSQEFFDQLFADPDWGEIYTLAGIQGTEYEGKEAYVKYMEQKVGDQELTFSKTSAGLSGGQKYIVKLGEEKVATFTIHNTVTGELDIPQWELSNVEAGFFTRKEAVTVTTQAGRTVTLNGIPLDESHIIRTTSTVVENYLPEGVHGPRTATVYAQGFLVPPEVLVIDEAGQLVELIYDADTKSYTEAAMAQSSAEISQEEQTALVEATKAYGRYIIGATSQKPSKYFDTGSQIYKIISKNEQFFKGYTSYGFTEPVITEYHRYTEDLFSARMQITLNTYRKDGTVKPFEINSTIFMTLHQNKGWIISNITNVHVHEEEVQVKLTWMQNDEVLSSGMVDAFTASLTPPAVTVPEGMEFLGWFRESMDENGDTVLTRVFTPSENGSITLPSDYVLDPMVLHARFQKEGG